jgi:protein SCO1/2
MSPGHSRVPTLMPLARLTQLSRLVRLAQPMPLTQLTQLVRLARLVPLLFLLTVALTRASVGLASPPDLRDITYTQRLGNTLPLQATLRDEHGAPVRLSDLTNGKPLILALGYFHCPSLCGVVRADLFHALGNSDLVGGQDYALVDVSIDPAETSADAASAKTQDIARFPAAGAERGWHFLTGSPAVIQSIADAVGFRDRFDPRLKQFLHPSGIVFVTPAGVISSYLLGVGYKPGDVSLAVTRANHGTVAAAALPILLLCYDYDESTGRYTLAIMKLLRLAGAITVLTVGVTLFLAFRRGRGRSAA